MFQTKMPPPSPPGPPKRLSVGAPQPPSWFKKSAELGLSAGGILLFFMFMFSFVVSSLSAFFAIGILCIVLRAIIFYKAFEWFLSPYTNTTVPSFAICVAMSVVLTALWRPTRNKPNEEAEKQPVFTTLGIYLSLLITLGLMWFVHAYQDKINEWFAYFSNWIVGF